MNNAIAKRVQVARTTLLLDQPFFGVLALQLKIFEDLNAPTAYTDGHSMGYNPDFFAKLNNDELVAVIAHEVMHCACGHPWRRDARHNLKWNFACVASHSLITMADSSRKPIGLIRPGEYVLSPYGPSRVLSSIYSGIKPTLELDTDSNLLHATPEHRIFTNEGFVNAKSINNNEQGWILRPRVSERLHSRELPNTQHQEIINRDGSFLYFNLGVSEKERLASKAGETESQASELGTVEVSILRAMGLLSGTSGWRRDNLSEEAWKILSTYSGRIEHIVSTPQVPNGLGFLSKCNEEQYGSSLLAPTYYRLPDRRTIAWDSALFGDQEDSRRAIAALHNHAESTELSRGSHQRDVRDLAESQGAERARIQIREGTSFPVFDIVTEHHCYYANGLLVHNCDFAINEILTKAGFKLPKGCLLDKQYDGKHAEWIYDRLPDIKTITIYGGGCGIGEVRDSPGANGDQVDKDGNPIKTEADWQQAVQQSLNAAKMQRKLPANIERELGQLCQPTVDWRSLLRKYVQEIVKADYTWTMPNRRYLASGFYLPALHSLACGRIAVGIDTSGSIDQVLLSQFAAELQAIVSEVQPSQVDVMYCDSRVHRHDTFMQGEVLSINAVGGGGTSFIPVFEKVARDVDPPKVLIYLTDLMGDFPKEAPEYPVIWCACADGKVPFGELVLCTL